MCKFLSNRVLLVKLKKVIILFFGLLLSCKMIKERERKRKKICICMLRAYIRLGKKNRIIANIIYYTILFLFYCTIVYLYKNRSCVLIPLRFNNSIGSFLMQNVQLQL